MPPSSPPGSRLDAERKDLLHRIENRLELPLVALGFVWLVLLVVDLTAGLAPWLESLSIGIWILFVLDFALKFTLAPDKGRYLAVNWLTALSLLLPALRVFRIVRAVRVLRAARAARGLRLVRVIGSVNRGMRALGATMGRRGFGYVAALTLMITFAGAAGMHSFEAAPPGEPGFRSYADALWWTAMVMATMGSDYWPQSAEGRLLCLFLSLYAFTVFGYVTATLATFFIGRDAENAKAEAPSADAIEGLRQEVIALRAELQSRPRGEQS